MSYVHADAPPFLLIHGLADQWLSPIQSERFVTALRAEGVPVEYIEVPDADHFMWEYNLDDIQLDQVEAFIRGL